ncbi:ABC transporter permease [Gordonibacter sp. 28C]|uniref:ABC transporter permease n=1 Tax=Gordonibacter sp. 28C TaxID=2078569 RepID=UPI001313E654|nr:ABC transporter permease [Gordonibacter sp. 28C]
MVSVRNLVPLAIAYIRKSRSQTAGMAVLVMISAFLLNIGLTFLFQYGQFFDERADELNVPHLALLQPEAATTPEQNDYLAHYPGLKDLETVPVLSAQGEFYAKGSKTTAVFIFDRIDADQNMSPPTLLEEGRPLDDESVYAPYIMKTAGKYKLGDNFTFAIGGRQKTFTIAGFTEEITFGSLMRTNYRFYCTPAAYAELSEDLPLTNSVLLTAQFEDAGESLSLLDDYYREFFFSHELENASSFNIEALPLQLVREDHTSIPWVLAVLLIAFALILLVICLLTIHFRISESIEQNVQDIGALQAMGYTSRQISSSLVLQFLLIALVGSIAGILLALVVLPGIALVLESQSALRWEPLPDGALIAATLFAICLIIALATVLASLRFRKLRPLTALRRGIEAHNFKRNRFPLETTRGPLSLIIGAKQIVGNARQGAMLSFIMAAVTFAAVCGISIYYNVGVDSSGFIKVITGETADATLVVSDEGDTEELLDRLNGDPDVRKAFGFQSTTLAVDGINTVGYIVEDFGCLEGDMLVYGRYPKHRNEIAIGGNAAGMAGKGVGDTLTVAKNGHAEECYITGILQMLNHSGLIAALPLDSLRSLQSDYQFTQVYVSLNEGVDVDAFLDSTAGEYREALSAAVDTNAMLDAKYGNYADIAALIAALVLCITLVVIILVFYTGMKTTMMRCRRDMGVQKALGFTTAQFMNQIAFNYVPIIFVGVVVGGVVGYYCFNPLFVLVTAAFGVVKTSLPVPYGWVAVTCVVLVAVSYLVSLFVALRIRKVSPYELISE